MHQELPDGDRVAGAPRERRNVDPRRAVERDAAVADIRARGHRDGTVLDTRLNKQSGHPALDQAALAALEAPALETLAALEEEGREPFDFIVSGRYRALTVSIVHPSATR